TNEDVDAIVAYLRTVPAVENDIPERQPLPVTLKRPAEAVPESAIPHTTLKPSDKTYARAENGRHLAARGGFGVGCHKPLGFGAPQALDLGALFAGGRTFWARDWGVALPPPGVLYSYNVTPDSSGIKDWTPQMVLTAITTGKDDKGAGLCRPMPTFGELAE